MQSSERIAPGEIHLHVVDDTEIAAEPAPDSYWEIMSADEHVRYSRFRFERDRRQFVITRALLRSTLSRYAPEVAPRDWRFKQNGYGRPAIDNEIGQALDFNLSHTAGRAALAVSRSAVVGVDVEWRGRALDSADLAHHFFAAEEAMDLPADPVERDRQFFQLWTLKEAYVKARGMGLSIPLASFSIGFPGENALSLCVDDPSDNACAWQLWTLDVGEDHALSVAAMTVEPCRLRLFRNVPMSLTQETECRILRRLRGCRRKARAHAAVAHRQSSVVPIFGNDNP